MRQAIAILLVLGGLFIVLSTVGCSANKGIAKSTRAVDACPIWVSNK